MQQQTKRNLSIGLIFFLYLGLVSAIWWELENINRAVVQEQSLNTASGMVGLLASFRTLYTSEVINKLPDDIVTVTHDYHLRDNAVPLPATLTLKLAETASQNQQGFEVSLFSGHPFPWRTGLKLDDFSLRALETLRVDPSNPVVEIQTLNEQTFLRYAEADLMRESCVGCHNSHPDSPKTDWQVGDVRGVLAVKLPMTQTAEASSNALRDLLLLVILIGIAAVAINLHLLLNLSDDT